MTLPMAIVLATAMLCATVLIITFVGISLANRESRRK